MESELSTTREVLSRQLSEAIARDPIGALPFIAALQKETEQHLREAVRLAALTSSWREIATALGVSKQAAHQRFKVYAKGVTDDLKTHHRAMQEAHRRGDSAEAARARTRRDELADQLRTAARALKA
jgi:hypothetical protein